MALIFLYIDVAVLGFASIYGASYQVYQRSVPRRDFVWDILRLAIRLWWGWHKADIGDTFAIASYDFISSAKAFYWRPPNKRALMTVDAHAARGHMNGIAGEAWETYVGFWRFIICYYIISRSRFFLMMIRLRFTFILHCNVSKEPRAYFSP